MSPTGLAAVAASDMTLRIPVVLVEIVGGFMDDATGLKPNTIELATGIVSQLR